MVQGIRLNTEEEMKEKTTSEETNQTELASERARTAILVEALEAIRHGNELRYGNEFNVLESSSASEIVQARLWSCRSLASQAIEEWRKGEPK